MIEQDTQLNPYAIFGEEEGCGGDEQLFYKIKQENTIIKKETIIAEEKTETERLKKIENEIDKIARQNKRDNKGKNDR